MPIFTFEDAKQQLKQRIGNRNDITDATLAKYINQSQHVMATNVLGIDIFEANAVPLLAEGNASGYLIAAAPPAGLGITNLWAIQTVIDVTEGTARRRLHRGEWDLLLNMANRMQAPPTLWFHRFNYIWFNTILDKDRLLQIIYRRTSVLDTLEIPDEFFDHLVNLACVFVYPTIGRNKEKDELYAKMPQNLQIAMLNPLTPSQWSALFDNNMAIYAEY